MVDIDVEATVETLGPIGLPVHEVTQTILADPERKHVHGNCLQAAVASIFGLPLEAVPSFVQFTWWEGALKLWARGYGVDPQWHEGSEPPQGLALVLGTSPRGFGHAVVGLAGEILFDPHPSRDGLTAIEAAVTFPSWLHGDSKCWACNTPHDVRAELARLRSVVAGVEALAKEWEREAADAAIQATDLQTIATNHAEGWQVMDETLRRVVRRLRSVLSDTKGDAQ